MANTAHVEKLLEGTRAWNCWREENPDIDPDLSGIDTKKNQKLRDALLEEKDGLFAVREINFRRTNLTHAILDELVFIRVDLIGADLSDAHICHCRFERGGFSVTVPEIEAVRLPTGNIPSESAEAFRKTACKLKNTLAFGTTFRIFSMSFADLSTLLVDEATRFEQVGVIGTIITQARLQMLEDYGGLSAGRRSKMQIVDDVARLRESFSGFWNLIHLIAFSCFLAPYTLFIVEQWIVARMASASGKPLSGDTGYIVTNLLRFIWSGGSTWRTWHLNPFAVSVFLVAVVLNTARAALFFKTKQIEHRQSVTGVYNEFRLQGMWDVLHRSYRHMAVATLMLVVIHSIMFLFTHVPF